MTVEASRTRVVWEYAPAPESTDHVRLRDRYGLFLDGAFAEPADGRWVPTINPATEEPIAEVGWAGPADVTRAVESARAAQPGWAALPDRERGKYLFRVARLIQERARELAVVETLDGGKPLRESAMSTSHSPPRTSFTTPAGPTSSTTASTPAGWRRSASSGRSCPGTSR